MTHSAVFQKGVHTCSARIQFIRRPIAATRSFKFFRGSHSEIMQTIKFPVLVLVLIANLSQAKVVIKSSTPDETTSDLVDDLVTIVTTCYRDRIRDGIGLAGELPDTLVRRLSSQHLVPMVLFDNSTKLPPWVPVETRHKLQIFIVGASSYKELQDIILLGIRCSVWWNHMASFIILDRSSRCRRSSNFLGIAWQINILNAKVMCYTDKNVRTIVTFNPFTSLAPVPWKMIRVITSYGHPFTFFVRESTGNEAICVNLDFDKVKNCSGYPIKLLGSPSEFGRILRGNSRSAKDFLLIHTNILEYVYDTLKVESRFTDIRTDCDMEFTMKFIDHSWVFRLVSYPFMHTGFVLLSKFRGNKSQLKKILGVIDTNSHIGLIIVYLITLIFFKFVVRQALVPAILNLVRITCGSGFANVPDRNPPRIYVTGILFFAVTMHGIFEGNLASLLTTIIPLRNVNALQDVVEFDYTLYGYVNVSEISSGFTTEVKERFVVFPLPIDCVMKVHHEKSSACIMSFFGSALDVANEFKLHLSEQLLKSYVVFGIRWDWPLEEKFNILLSRLVEADALEPWAIKCNPMKLEDFQTDQDVKENKDFKKIELSELTFAFVILGIGLTLASVAFIVEMGIHYTCRRICKRKKRFGNMNPTAAVTENWFESIRAHLNRLHRC